MGDSFSSPTEQNTQQLIRRTKQQNEPMRAMPPGTMKKSICPANETRGVAESTKPRGARPGACLCNVGNPTTFPGKSERPRYRSPEVGCCYFGLLIHSHGFWPLLKTVTAGFFFFFFFLPFPFIFSTPKPGNHPSVCKASSSLHRDL